MRPENIAKNTDFCQQARSSFESRVKVVYCEASHSHISHSSRISGTSGVRVSLNPSYFAEIDHCCVCGVDVLDNIHSSSLTPKESTEILWDPVQEITSRET
jgi:hypothetical protein